jgi:hypothetical protein
MQPVLKYFLAAIGLTALLGAGALMIIFERPGGMPPNYRAIDYDPKLTAIAHEAVPIINSINRFYATHGKCPRATRDDLMELRHGLDSHVIATISGEHIEFRLGAEPSGWSYYSFGQNPSSCTLTKKLGWDPSLVWQRDGSETQWIFVPGDGSEDKLIQLDVSDLR